MQTQKAVVQYVDSLRRVVLITENNEAVLVYSDNWQQYSKDDVVMIYREDRDRRMTDWRIV